MLLFLLSSYTFALKFDMKGHAGHESSRYERCIRNFVAKDQLVVVTAIVEGNRGDGMSLNIHVRGRPCRGHIVNWAHLRLGIFKIGHYEGKLISVNFPDQRRRRERVWQTKRCSRREPLRLHISC